MACRGSINDDTAVIPMGGGSVSSSILLFHSMGGVARKECGRIRLFYYATMIR